MVKRSMSHVEKEKGMGTDKERERAKHRESFEESEKETLWGKGEALWERGKERVRENGRD